MLSVRLDPETRKLLVQLARKHKVSRSELVRRGLHLLAEQDRTSRETEPFNAIRHLIGRVDGGAKNLSERTGARFRELLSRKRSSR
jgi:Arc/MetJ-type ribon-helix-helix transcriptional regulator